MRFSAELIDFSQDGHAVDASVELAGGRVSVHASYLVAADGAHGPIRAVLGIARSGPGVLGHRLSILASADLGARMAPRASAVYWLRPGRAPAGSLFVAVDNKDHWLMSVPHDPDSEPRESVTQGRCLELVRAGLGDDSVDVRYLGHRFWDPHRPDGRALPVRAGVPGRRRRPPDHPRRRAASLADMLLSHLRPRALR